MLKHALAAAAFVAAVAGPASAEMYKDYTPSKEVWNVTMVKVKPGKIDEYLLGLRQTWVPSCEEQKKVGLVLDCSIMVSTTASNPQFNVMLVIKSPNAAVGDPNAALYEKVTAALRARMAKDAQEKLVSSYEEIRTFEGEQDFREILFK